MRQQKLGGWRRHEEAVCGGWRRAETARHIIKSSRRPYQTYGNIINDLEQKQPKLL